jgi:putative pyruvate formate lyase activating enzyme
VNEVHQKVNDSVRGFQGESPYAACRLCPRACGVNREAGQVGVCGASSVLRLGRAALHWWEEPCLVGDKGSGAVFFSHCPLRCVYCQNRELVAGSGIEVTSSQFKDTLLRLQNEEHAANINLVTPTHYVPSIAPVLRELREGDALKIPVVYNTSSFDSPLALQLMEGLVDVYLADFKYASAFEAGRLSHAPHYPEVALAAIDAMVSQVPTWEENEEGLLQKGVIVRHLVLPGRVEESKRALEVLNSRYGTRIRLSIMSQYTPLTKGLERYGLEGRVTEGEYEEVLDFADDLGIEDYFWQQGDAAKESFVPAFNGEGVL